MTNTSNKHFASLVAAIFCAFITVGASIAPAIHPIAAAVV
jgi:hypothetical protein